jgi:hypothetical protein
MIHQSMSMPPPWHAPASQQASDHPRRIAEKGGWTHGGVPFAAHMSLEEHQAANDASLKEIDEALSGKGLLANE